MATVTIGGRNYEVEVRPDSVVVDGHEYPVTVRDEGAHLAVNAGSVAYRVQLPPAGERESGMTVNVDYRPFTLEYRARRADGHYRWVLDTGAPQLGPDGDFSGYVGSALDISERRHGEHQRAELLRREQTARAEAEVAVRRASFINRRASARCALIHQ